MKNILLILLTGSLLAACTPKNDTTTTTTDPAVTDTTADTTIGDAADTTVDATTDAVDTTVDATENAVDDATADATNNPADPGVDSTLTNDDDAGAGEELDMAVGDGLEGTVADFDGTAQTFTLNENDANYAVTTSATTVYEGLATTPEEFFGTDRANADVAVEGSIDEATSTLQATKITLN